MHTVTIPSPDTSGAGAHHNRPGGESQTTSLLAVRPRSRVVVGQDVMICNDCSPSMLDEDKLRDSSAAALAFVQGLAAQEGIRTGVVTFYSQARIKVPLMPARQASAAFHGLTKADVRDGTNIAAALRVACEAQRAARAQEPNVRSLKPVCVIYSDGMHNCDDECPEEAAAMLKRQGWTIVSVGFGTDCDSDLLRLIASSPSHFYLAADGHRLIELFRRIAYSVSVSVAAGVDPARSLGQLH